MLNELGYRILLLSANRLKKEFDDAYTRHELEDGDLSLFEKLRNLLQARHHSRVIAYGTRHASRQLCTQSMVNVQLVRRTGGKEGVVEAWSKLANCQKIVKTAYRMRMQASRG